MAGNQVWTPVVTAVVATIVLVGGYELFGVRPAATLTEQQSQHEEAAFRLREAAKRMCAQRRYRECLSLLDEAKRFAPEREADPEVQDARRQATAALASGEERSDEGGRSLPESGARD